mmetsp:Transcript_2127/g.3765  ORF Transcript_2127/g.3765 Transcript_2127/m.3765 type:complete len:163 (-) Transcript_2127:233-721(-)|eukprot:CAMPEP_0201883344 /NCGR_PEP_ID=MMETSP0902-20130614/15450_1 /ASSEMBLY_ACC=CAM_ASM_000551 /TAXON_ID=420261 /ORGANISM="Thalassiosira antarctica, Strain CCMP982" /LENGTH=162 /DNA_ID=CAMNT_0048412103 /DNA_START=99 /DNA_END=587 /DNA_ORIENTATION=-
MRAALRQLCKHGVDALRAQKVNDKWRKPNVSKRVAADLRKLAIRNGTYGQFDTETGVGWNPAWDAPERKKKDDLEHRTNKADDAMAADNLLLMGSNQGGIQSIRPPKETKRERTRESRAQKIEDLLAQADEKIEEYRKEQEGKKPKLGIEEEFKRAMKSSSW